MEGGLTLNHFAPHPSTPLRMAFWIYQTGTVILKGSSPVLQIELQERTSPEIIKNEKRFFAPPLKLRRHTNRMTPPK
jgi:hypothetical protein